MTFAICYFAAVFSVLAAAWAFIRTFNARACSQCKPHHRRDRVCDSGWWPVERTCGSCKNRLWAKDCLRLRDLFQSLLEPGERFEDTIFCVIRPRTMVIGWADRLFDPKPRILLGLEPWALGLGKVTRGAAAHELHHWRQELDENLLTRSSTGALGLTGKLWAEIRAHYHHPLWPITVSAVFVFPFINCLR